MIFFVIGGIFQLFKQFFPQFFGDFSGLTNFSVLEKQREKTQMPRAKARGMGSIFLQLAVCVQLALFLLHLFDIAVEGEFGDVEVLADRGGRTW